MRISGGTAKGRRVVLRASLSKRQEADALRPTSAKVRKAIFDILGPRIIGCRFLDLYAGTGAVGLEALSRGADFVIFIDDSPARTRAITDLVRRYGFSEKAHVITDKAVHFVTSLKAGAVPPDALHPYDVLFLDPPYHSAEIEMVLPCLSDSGLLKPHGLLIVEHPSKRALPHIFGALSETRRYRYGDTSLTLYVHDADREDTPHWSPSMS
jgi:16S rRNA (guanine(966)-N(2))-methyltransferase RsmD